MKISKRNPLTAASFSLACQHVRGPPFHIHRLDDRLLCLLRCHLPWHQGNQQRVSHPCKNANQSWTGLTPTFNLFAFKFGVRAVLFTGDLWLWHAFYQHTGGVGRLCCTGLLQLLLQLATGALPRTRGHGLHVSAVDNTRSSSSSSETHWIGKMTAVLSIFPGILSCHHYWHLCSVQCKAARLKSAESHT